MAIRANAELIRQISEEPKTQEKTQFKLYPFEALFTP